MNTNRLLSHLRVPMLMLSLGLAACAAATPPAHRVDPVPAPWPPAWRDDGQAGPEDFTPPSFDAPSATHCHRLPVVREVPGGGRSQADAFESRKSERSRREDLGEPAAEAGAVAPAVTADPRTEAKAHGPAAPMPAPRAAAPAPRPANERVTAGMVDDNADFGAWLDYRRRKAGLPVRDRDVSERYLLEVTDTQGRPVHDAEVAVQRAGVAEPVMRARTDAAGRVWLHPRAFLGSRDEGENLSVAVRKGRVQSRAPLVRGQAQAVQVRLGVHRGVAAPRLDLVFLVDATGSMGDEIAKLKNSMRAMSQQIAQLPGRPDICYGLAAYRDRGDAFLTRSHDFTDELGAFQEGLARLQAGGGGDTPEALNEALHETVHGLSWRDDAVRLVVLVADAPPHLDYTGCRVAHEPAGRCPQYDRGMQAALAKGIKLFPVGASGLDPVGEYVFRQMAQYTAGRFVFLTYRDASDPGSGPGSQTSHEVRDYSVQTLDKLVVRLVGDELAKLPRS